MTDFPYTNSLIASIKQTTYHIQVKKQKQNSVIVISDVQGVCGSECFVICGIQVQMAPE